MPPRIVAQTTLHKTPLIGWNCRETTSPRYEREYHNGETMYTRHAEMHLLDQINLQPNIKRHRLKVWIFRMLSDGSLSMAKPCTHCQDRLKEAGIRASRIYYTNWEGEWVCLRRY